MVLSSRGSVFYRGINQQRTMFDYIVESLSPKVATEVLDLLLNLPMINPLTVLKEQLIKRTAASEQCWMQQLLSLEDLGDCKPTQVLRRMQQLLGDTPGLIDSSFLRELFLQYLPANVRMVLANASDTVPLNELAQLADRIVEVATPSVSAVKVSPNINELEKLHQDVAELKQLLTSQHGGRYCSPSPAPRQSSGDNICLETKHRNVDHLAPIRETARPVTSGDECRPTTKSPILCC
ncbi:uncharacterized protein [Dysidea avara]|uniref:uncharacterized protein n=1 Tax=Dysidea avara TaxID=196820 RepID=UPI0033334B9C